MRFGVWSRRNEGLEFMAEKSVLATGGWVSNVLQNMPGLFLYLQRVKRQWQPSTMVWGPSPESPGPAMVSGAGVLRGCGDAVGAGSAGECGDVE